MASLRIQISPTCPGGKSWPWSDTIRTSVRVRHWPEDTKITPVSRTIGEDRVVDEVIIAFTHDCEMPAILPSVKPTGRKAVIPFVVVVGFDDGKVAFERIYWDQASLLVQIGLMDNSKLPVTGAEQAARLIDPSLPSNTLIPTG